MLYCQKVLCFCYSDTTNLVVYKNSTKHSCKWCDASLIILLDNYCVSVAELFYLMFSFFSVQWAHSLLKESFIQRAVLCWWLSVDQTVCCVCGCCCGPTVSHTSFHIDTVPPQHHGWHLIYGLGCTFWIPNSQQGIMRKCQCGVDVEHLTDIEEFGKNNGCYWER